MCIFVSNKLEDMFILDENDKMFIEKFNNKEFKPEILFGDFEVNEISNHPMALWRCKQ